MKKIFLQFYRKENYLYGPDEMINFNNGLSYVWDLIKERGEFVWRDVNDESDLIDEGEIYASVWYTKSLRLLHSWAKKYPKLHVYICGPIVLHYGINIGKDLNNFHIIKEDAEDVFTDGKTSKWNLEIPDNIQYSSIGYSVGYVKGYGCYWARCRYCKIPGGKLQYRPLTEIPIIENPATKYVWIHVYSMPPHGIETIYSTLPNRTDVHYATYVRGDKYTTLSLRKVLQKMKLNPKYLGFNIGIEFPSNHILEYMDKGVTVQEYLDFIKLCCEHNIRLHFNFILGWKTTSLQDVKDVDYFLKEIGKFSKPNTMTANLYPLTIVQGRRIFDDYKMAELEPFDTDYDVLFAMPKIDEKVKQYTEEIRNLFQQFPFLRLNDYSPERWAVHCCGKK